eukprot:367358_1
MSSRQMVAGLSGVGIATLLYEMYRWKHMDCDWTTSGYLYPRSVDASYFKNRIIWITGASSGIGKALCYYLLSLKVGVKLIISSRRKNILQQLKHDLLSKYKNTVYGTDIYILPINLTKKPIKYYVKQYELIKDYFNITSIDILINNAGIGMLSTFQKFDAKNSADMLQTNLTSPIILTKLVLTDMINNNKNDSKTPFGHICNVGSVAAYLSMPYQSTYCATKSGLLSFGKTITQELERYENITITDVLPGPVNTEIDINSKLSHGRTAGKKSKFIETGMSSERCAELICIAISNKLRESWPCKGVSLYGVYIAHYNPWFYNKFISRNVGQPFVEKKKPKSKL